MNSIITLQGPSSTNCLCNMLLNCCMALVQFPSTYLWQGISATNFYEKLKRTHRLPSDIQTNRQLSTLIDSGQKIV
jgi:hypothetical protein